MRIIMLVEHYPTTFKPYFNDLFQELVRRGHHLIVMAHGEWKNEQEPQLADNRHLVVSRYPTTLKTLPARIPALLSRALSSPIRSARLANAAARGQASTKTALLHASRALLLPTIDPDIILIHNTTTLSYFPFLKQAFPRTPLGFYYHGGEVAGTPEVWNTSELFRIPDVILTNTEASKAHIVLRGAPAEAVRIVPVGFPLGSFPDIGARSYRPGSALRVFTVGRLSKEKGITDALHAVSEVIRSGVAVHYTIVGNGPQMSEIQALVKELDLEAHVRMEGYVARARLVRMYADCDVLLLPSVPMGNAEETQACVAQEAMLMRAPVVASRIGGVPESIPTAMHRFLFKPGDRAEMAQRLKEIAALSVTELAELGGVGKAFVEKGYDIVAIAEKTIGFIANAMRRARVGS